MQPYCPPAIAISDLRTSNKKYSSIFEMKVVNNKSNIHQNFKRDVGALFLWDLYSIDREGQFPAYFKISLLSTSPQAERKKNNFI